VAATLVGQFFPWLLEQAGIRFVFLFFAASSAMLLVLIRLILTEAKDKTLKALGQEWH